MDNRTKFIWAIGLSSLILSHIYYWKFGLKSEDEASIESPTSSKSTQSDATVGAASSNQLESGDPVASSDVGQPMTGQQASGQRNADLSDGTKAPENTQSEQTSSLRNESQESAAKPPSQRVFKGIKQANNDVMVSEIKYTPGDLEDAFVATFQTSGGAKGFDGNVWIIGDYVQRGTTGIMAMPSHSELKLAADGSPGNPKGGLRLTVSGGRAESVSRKFSIKRPGFDGEELSQIRIGVYDRSTGKLHIAKVSAAELAKKRTTKRVRVDGEN